MLIINYKAYRKAIGENSEKMTKKIDSAKPENVEIIVAPQTADLNRLRADRVKKFAQHTDPMDAGSHTGSNQLKAVKESGAEGTLINHSERRLEDEEIKSTVEKCSEENLTSIVCAQTVEQCSRYADYRPDYIAFEPPELIGGDIAVSTAEPGIIKTAVEKSGDVPTLTGAGIKTNQDVERSLELGCEGVLIASGVIKSENVEKKVKELCAPL